MAAPAANSQDSSDVSLSPGQAKFLYWFIGMVPILKALTPFTTYLGNRKTWLKKLAQQSPPIKELTKTALTDIYRNVVSDFARQTVTCSFQLMSYFIVGDLIKAVLNKVYAKIPEDRQDPGLRQVLMQCIPLAVQVIATVLSRNMGAAELQALFDVDPKTGEYQVIAKKPDSFANLLKYKLNSLTNATKHYLNKSLLGKKTETVVLKSPGTLAGYLQPQIKKFIDHSLRVGGQAAGNLRPVKASLTAIGAMTVYFSALVGLLYGSSALLEKVFPDSFKTKKPKGKPKPQPLAVPSSPLILPATIGMGAVAYNTAPRNSRQPFTMVSPTSVPPPPRVPRPGTAYYPSPRPYSHLTPNPLSFSHF